MYVGLKSGSKDGWGAKWLAGNGAVKPVHGTGVGEIRTPAPKATIPSKGLWLLEAVTLIAIHYIYDKYCITL